MVNNIKHIDKLDSLNTGRNKINEFAIDPANRAEANSIDAKNVANQSNQTSNDAKDIAVNTDDRLDNMLAGELQDGEVVDARKPYGEEAFPTLGKRLDDYDFLMESLGANVKKFGAIGDGIADDTAAVKRALNYVRDRGIGGSIYFPAGKYNISETLNYTVLGVKSLKITGEGERSTEIRWIGGSGAVFDNRKTEINQHEYGLVVRDLSITGRFDSQTTAKDGSVGIYIDMTHDWILDNVHINGFDRGAIIGVHSDNGKILNSKLQYNNVGLDAYGDQTDNLVVANTWFTASKTRGVELSSPRATFRNCMFVSDATYSDANNYVDIQIGHKVVKLSDKNKSNYMQTSTGALGMHANIVDCHFEGAGVFRQPAILVDNFDGSLTAPGLNINNNYFALYDRECAVKLNVDKPHLTTSNNKMSSRATKSYFLDYSISAGSFVEYNEPYIPHIFKTDAQRWAFGATATDFNQLPHIANVVNALGSWTPANPSFDGGVRISTDFDGLGRFKTTLSNSSAQSVVLRLTLINCPVGMLYLSTAFIAKNTSANMFVSAHRGSGSSFLRVGNIPLTSSKKDIVFGVYNETVSTVVIDFTLSQKVDDATVIFDEILIKHENNVPQSFLLMDTKSGLRFTRRTGQMFDLPNKIPYIDVLDYDNIQNGAIYFSDHSFTEILRDGGYLTGEKIINVRDATKIKVGEHLFFRRLVNNVDIGYQGKQNTGNNVVSVVGNVVTLEEGLPFAVSNESKVMSCKVFKKPNTTILQ